jgi:hypothetical protein
MRVKFREESPKPGMNRTKGAGSPRRPSMRSSKRLLVLSAHRLTYLLKRWETKKLRTTQPKKKMDKASQDGTGMEYPKILVIERGSLVFLGNRQPKRNRHFY